MPLKEQLIDSAISQAFSKNLIEREEVEDLNSIFKSLNQAFNSPVPCFKETESKITSRLYPMAGKNAHVNFKSISVNYESNPSNQSIILNPKAIVDTLDPRLLLRRDKP